MEAMVKTRSGRGTLVKRRKTAAQPKSQGAEAKTSSTVHHSLWTGLEKKSLAVMAAMEAIFMVTTTSFTLEILHNILTKQ